MVRSYREAALPADPNFLDRRVFLALVAAVAAGYVLLWLGYGGQTAIEVYNALVFGISAGVTVTYGVPSAAILRQRYLTGQDVLTVGIMISWSATFFARSISIAWRFQGKPVEWLDSVLWGLHIPGTLMGGVSHLIAHAAVDGRIPTSTMRRWGFRTAFITATAALGFIAGDVLDFW